MKVLYVHDTKAIVLIVWLEEMMDHNRHGALTSEQLAEIVKTEHQKNMIWTTSLIIWRLKETEVVSDKKKDIKENVAKDFNLIQW